MWRIKEFNPPQWAKLTEGGDIEVGDLEVMVLEVAQTVFTMGWPAAKDLHLIEIPETMLRPFRMGIERALSIFHEKAMGGPV